MRLGKCISLLPPVLGIFNRSSGTVSRLNTFLNFPARRLTLPRTHFPRDSLQGTHESPWVGCESAGGGARGARKWGCRPGEGGPGESWKWGLWIRLRWGPRTKRRWASAFDIWRPAGGSPPSLHDSVSKFGRTPFPLDPGPKTYCPWALRDNESCRH